MTTEEFRKRQEKIAHRLGNGFYEYRGYRIFKDLWDDDKAVLVLDANGRELDHCIYFTDAKRIIDKLIENPESVNEYDRHKEAENFAEYMEYVKKTPMPESMKFGEAIFWVPRERLPQALRSLGDTNLPVIRIPAYVRNCHGFNVPVVRFSEDVFKGKDHITDIVLPSTIGGIPAGAFSGCRFLKNITIPKNVKYIGEGTFADCTSLKNIWYEGTPEEFDRMEIVSWRHEIQLGSNEPGTPVSHILSEERRHIPGNEAWFTANVHFRCSTGDTDNREFIIKAKGKDVTKIFMTD
ncbi:MAG: leucine-rich repeat domain-containing protein [Clostridiales bacterium]|nr:leucine-rich repeat domain-containing protein [Clostridiales bacterium]